MLNASQAKGGARTRACRVHSHVNALAAFTETQRRDESRRGTPECVRHGSKD